MSTAAGGLPEKRPEEPSPKSDGLTEGWLKDGLGVGAVLVVGVLAAVGITGDLLTRLVRNNGNGLLVWLMVAISIATVLVAIAVWSRSVKGFASVVLVLGLGLVLIKVAWLGKDSLKEREQPGVSIAVADGPTSSGTLLVTAGATASGLRSSEHLLLEVTGWTVADVEEKENKNKENENAVTTTTGPGHRAFEDVCRNGDAPSYEHLLSWTVTGPNAKGEAVTQVTVRSKSKAYEFYCAYAGLVRRLGSPITENSFAFVAAEAPLPPLPPLPTRG